MRVCPTTMRLAAQIPGAVLSGESPLERVCTDARGNVPPLGPQANEQLSAQYRLTAARRSPPRRLRNHRGPTTFERECKAARMSVENTIHGQGGVPARLGSAAPCRSGSSGVLSEWHTALHQIRPGGALRRGRAGEQDGWARFCSWPAAAACSAARALRVSGQALRTA
jgi:hypothetical protein